MNTGEPPFWSWNCKVTRELIRSQMEVFQKMGFGGAHLHPRTGLDTEYLGEEFMELVSYADEQAKERGMLCWLYDEDRYPSGAAGGNGDGKLELPGQASAAHQGEKDRYVRQQGGIPESGGPGGKSLRVII